MTSMFYQFEQPSQNIKNDSLSAAEMVRAIISLFLLCLTIGMFLVCTWFHTNERAR